MSEAVNLWTCFVLLCTGFMAGLLHDALGIIKRATKNNLFVCITADIVVCVLAGFAFIMTIFRLEEGLFAFFEVVCFAFGLVLQQIIIKNTLASFVKWVYNKIKLKRKKQA